MKTLPPHDAFSASPFAWLAAACAFGIVAAKCSLHSFTQPQLLLFLLVLSAGLCTVSACASVVMRKHRAANGFTLLAFLFIGASLFVLEQQPGPAKTIKQLLESGLIDSGDPVEVTGVIKGVPEYAPDGIYFDLYVDRVRHLRTDHEASGHVSLALRTDPENEVAYELLELRHGARLRVMTNLNRADRYRNPGVSLFTEFLDRQGYDAAAFVKSPLLIERLPDDRVFLPLAWLFNWRRDLEQRISSTFSSETAGVLNAALLGNRRGLSRPVAERFREGGTFHVLVISGLHITFIGALVLFVARRLTRNRSLQFFAATILLWSYTLAVGAEVSVTRAAFMFTFVALASLVSRVAASLNALGAASLMLLAHRPSDLFDPSFQLTFLSVIAIVAVAWPILTRMAAIGRWRPTNETPYPPVAAPWLRELSELLFWDDQRWRAEQAHSNCKYRLFKSPFASVLNRSHLQPVLRYGFSAAVISLSVQLVLLPLQVVYFHRLSFASLVLNVGVSLLMALLSLVAVVALALTVVSSALATPFVMLANALNWLMLHSVDPFVWLRVSSMRLPEYAGWRWFVYALYYLPLWLLIRELAGWCPLKVASSRSGPIAAPWRRSFQCLLLLAQLVLICIVVWHPFSVATDPGRLRVDFLDVGQGDAALVTMPNGGTLLVDGGGRPDFWRQTDQTDDTVFQPDARPIGEAVVSEYLWARGMDQIDYVLATHADADHIDGLNQIVSNFEVRGALLARTPVMDREYRKFSESLNAEQIPVTLIGVGDTLVFGDAKATVLWPPAIASVAAASTNNDSIVLQFQFGDRTLLLTGDMEKNGEAAVLSNWRSVRADVIKVAHHGSRTSSTADFVNATQARLAVISVGRTSMFGHPHQEIVERWRASGAEVLTTGASGTITVTSDGKDLQVETFVPR